MKPVIKEKILDTQRSDNKEKLIAIVDTSILEDEKNNKKIDLSFLD
jgi:hypothetical protein